LHLELHLHELLPALMTYVVAKRVSATTNTATTSSAVKNNTTIAATANKHYALRREAAAALVHACRLFGDVYLLAAAALLPSRFPLLDTNFLPRVYPKDGPRSGI
jgi:hypothetical protein